VNLPIQEIFVRRDFQTQPQQIPEFRRPLISRCCRFMSSGLQKFATSKFHRFEIPDLRTFATSELRRFMTSGLHKFATLKLRKFEIPDLRTFVTSKLRRFKIPDFRKFDIPENLFHEFH
jgi:ferredoxin-fold anticodon binding domain-containing protein